MNDAASTPPTHCKVSPKFSLSRPIYLFDLQIPVAKTPCLIPLEDWPVCYADECYLNAVCASYSGTHPRFEPRKPTPKVNPEPSSIDEWD